MHIRRLLGLKKLWYSKDKVRYKHFARKYDMAVKDFILSQENNVLKKKSLSSFYSYVNSKLTTSQCIPLLIDSNDNLAVSNHDKCTVLNDYFASVFTADDGLLPEFVPRLSENNSLNCVLFPFDKVLKTLKSLPSKCSKTPDGFPAFFLKSLAPAIAFPLSLLFEMSMSTGHIPLVWKTAFVCPVFKKGSRKQASKFGGEELSVDANEVADYIFHVEGDDNEVEDQDEGEENDEDGIYSEDEDNEIAPAGFSGYGESDLLRGAELLTGACIQKRSCLSNIMGPRNQHRSVRNPHAGPGNEQLIRQDMVAAAVRLASILITNHSVNITNGHSEMEEYNLAAHLEISEKKS